MKKCKVCGKFIPHNHSICPTCKKSKYRQYYNAYFRDYFKNEENMRKQHIRCKTRSEQVKGNIIKADHCALCGSKENLVLHHNSFKDEAFNEYNVMTLCMKCNNTLHKVMKHV